MNKDRLIIPALEKLSLKEGDIVIARYKTPEEKESAKNLIQLISQIQLRTKLALPKCIFLLLHKDIGIEQIDEIQMNNAGWIKKQK